MLHALSEIGTKMSHKNEIYDQYRKFIDRIKHLIYSMHFKSYIMGRKLGFNH